MKKIIPLELITVAEAMEITRYARQTVYNKIQSGEWKRYGTKQRPLLDKREICQKCGIPFQEKSA